MKEASFNAESVTANIELPDSEGLTVLNIPIKATEVVFTFPNKLQYYIKGPTSGSHISNRLCNLPKKPLKSVQFYGTTTDRALLKC